ncbi:MAG: ROK family protein [Thermoleophilia bacterium]
MTSPRVIGVDLGGTKLLAGVVDRAGVVLERTLRETDVSSPGALLAQLDEAIAELAANGVDAIGLGLPAIIDQRRGAPVSATNVPLGGIDLRARMEQRFGVPVGVENDANAAALAEHRFGAGRGVRDMVMVTLGTGIGGGLILGGRLYRGARGVAGELGHVVVDLDGPPCQGDCPGHGHLEVLASGTAADALAQATATRHPGGDLGRAAAAGRHVDARLAVELAAAGDGDARRVIGTVAERLGQGLVGLVNTFDPEVVVLGGGFARAGELLFEPIRAIVRAQAMPLVRDEVRILPATLGVEAGLVGAGVVGFELLDHGA